VQDHLGAPAERFRQQQVEVVEAQREQRPAHRS
jgi:hypothetical protein